MIQNFRHKGLRRFFEKGDTSKIQPNHVKKLQLILARLNTARQLDDMAFPGSGLHPLSGSLKNYYAVSVSGNYRVTFRFENGKVYDVDYLDYH